MLVPLLVSSTSQRFVRPDSRQGKEPKHKCVNRRSTQDVSRRGSRRKEETFDGGNPFPARTREEIGHLASENRPTSLDSRPERQNRSRRRPLETAQKKQRASTWCVLRPGPCGYSLSRNRPTVPAIFDIITVERARGTDRERKRQPPDAFSYTFERESCPSFSLSAQIALKRTERQTSIKVVNGES